MAMGTEVEEAMAMAMWLNGSEIQAEEAYSVLYSKYSVVFSWPGTWPGCQGGVEDPLT